MRRFRSWLAATLCLGLGLVTIGCGGDDSKYLDEMSADEVQQLCSWSASVLEPGEYKCTDTTTMTAYSASECVSRFQKNTPPHCLVSLVQDCLNSIGGDPCKMLVSDSCKAYIACVARK